MKRLSQMKNKNYILVFGIFFLALVVFSSFSVAYEEGNEGEWETSQEIGLDELATIGSSLLATALFILTVIAYKRDKRKRLLYVSIAFFLFAIKGFLITSDIFFPEKGAWLDPTAKFLDFAILLSFFFGLLKK